MALTLGNPTLIQATANSIASHLAGLLNGGASNSTIEYHDNGGVGLLCTFDLDGSNPEFTTSANVISLDTSPAVSTTATGGSATTPNQYRVIDGDGTERLRGPITGTGPITTGDTVNLGSLSFTVPLSA